jgi:hypothetical protein
MIPVPLLILGVVAVGAAVAASGGSPSRKALESDVPNLRTARARWRASGWGELVDQQAIDLSNPHDVAVVVAQQVFPAYSWPATPSGPPNKFALWKTIATDVYSYLGAPDPFPAQ